MGKTQRLSLIALTVVVAGGCGKSDGQRPATGESDSSGVTFTAAIRAAQSVDASDFPAPKGRSLQEIAKQLPAVNVGLATSVFTVGENRLAFGVIDQEQRFVYGRTAVYLATGPDGEAIGPFPAPADPLVVEPRFRSRGAAEETEDIAAIYQAQVDLPRVGMWSVLSVSKAQGKMFGAATQIEVKRSSAIPARGELAPKVSTDTVARAAGDIASIDTRVPPDDMHDTDFRDVVGKKPVALLFATPQLCETRVCGPVTDIAAQLEQEYGDRMEFIHQEVYINNEVNKGLRPPLQAFKLQTEPWLFVIDRQGRVATRLEGSFGNGAFERAIQSAL